MHFCRYNVSVVKHFMFYQKYLHLITHWFHFLFRRKFLVTCKNFTIIFIRSYFIINQTDCWFILPWTIFHGNVLEFFLDRSYSNSEIKQNRNFRSNEPTQLFCYFEYRKLISSLRTSAFKNNIDIPNHYIPTITNQCVVYLKKPHIKENN